jgi:hypothetical protein
MKINLFTLSAAITLTAMINSTILIAQNTSPYWSLAGNSNAATTSKLGTTNGISLRFYTNNIQRMIINSAAGYVGIGTTTPVNILTVKVSGSTPAASWLSGGSSPVFMGFAENMSTGFNLATAGNSFNLRPVLNTRRSRGTLALPSVVSNNDYLASFVASGYDGTNFQNPASIDFHVDGTPSAGNIPARISLVTGSNVSNRKERLKVGSTGNFNFNNDQLFIQQSTGKVGIGTTDPAAKLYIRNPDNNTWGLAVENNVMQNVGEKVNNIAIFANADVDQGYGYGLRAVGGYRGVWGYGDGDGDGGVISVIGVEGLASGFGASGARIGVYGTANGAGTNYGVYGSIPGPPDETVFSAAGYFDGNVYAVTYNNISDRKFKTEITPLRNSLNQLMSLKASSYVFKKDNNANIGFPSGKQLGLIADEVKQVFPELVKPTVHPAKYDTNRTVLSPEVKYESVNYIGLIPVLIASIQEQQKQLGEQQRQIQELKQMVKQLNNEKGNIIGNNIRLEQNLPNPASGNTTIRYQVPGLATSARLTITNIKGQLIKTITIKSMGAGQVNFNSSSLAAGAYNYSLWVDGKQADTKSLIIAR